MLTLVDDLGQVSKNLGLRRLSSHSLSIKYSYDLCRHICKSFFKCAYLMSAKIVKRLILRDMFPLCLQRNVNNKLFPDC